MSRDTGVSFRRATPTEAERYTTCVPIVSLEAVAAAFSASQSFDENACEWTELIGGPAPTKGLFVAQVVGEAMNRRIPNGAWCLWRSATGGTPQRTVILAQNRDVKDPEFGTDYTVREYRFHEEEADYGKWRYEVATLHPDSDDPTFKSTRLPNLDLGDDCVVAELVAVLEPERGATAR